MSFAYNETYDLITLFGKPALYTILRVDPDTVPEGMYLYHIRHDDNGDACSIENSVLVNHLATVLTQEHMELGEFGKACTKEDITFRWTKLSLREFLLSMDIAKLMGCVDETGMPTAIAVLNHLPVTEARDVYLQRVMDQLQTPS